MSRFIVPLLLGTAILGPALLNYFISASHLLASSEAAPVSIASLTPSTKSVFYHEAQFTVANTESYSSIPSECAEDIRVSCAVSAGLSVEKLLIDNRQYLDAEITSELLNVANFSDVVANLNRYRERHHNQNLKLDFDRLVVAAAANAQALVNDVACGNDICVATLTFDQPAGLEHFQKAYNAQVGFNLNAAFYAFEQDSDRRIRMLATSNMRLQDPLEINSALQPALRLN